MLEDKESSEVVVPPKKEIKIQQESLNVLRKLFLNIQEKQKELEELKTRLDIGILISLTSNGILESEFENWRTDLDEGSHKEK